MPREKSFWLYSLTFEVWKTSKVRGKRGPAVEAGPAA